MGLRPWVGSGEGPWAEMQGQNQRARASVLATQKELWAPGCALTGGEGLGVSCRADHL